MVDICVMCGSAVPEGAHVCISCQKAIASADCRERS